MLGGCVVVAVDFLSTTEKLNVSVAALNSSSGPTILESKNTLASVCVDIRIDAQHFIYISGRRCDPDRFTTAVQNRLAGLPDVVSVEKTSVKGRNGKLYAFVSGLWFLVSGVLVCFLLFRKL